MGLGARQAAMLLDLSRLRAGIERVERKYPPSAFPDKDDFRVVAPVELTAEVRKDAKNVRLVGRLKTTLECECSRCLDPFAVPIDTGLDLLFLPVSTNAGTGELEVGDEDLGVSFYQEDTIDLGEVMREQFHLGLPMKPLCREDCRGLCPVCGANWNRETCTCSTAWEDPRLAPLKKLVDRRGD